MGNKSIKNYNYGYVELEEVISNPEEFIIPQCLPACKALWEKNIETFMVSNNEDDHLYVLLTNLSKENKEKIEQLTQNGDKRFFFDGYRSTYGIKVDGVAEDSMKELLSLTKIFEMQDTKRFIDEKTFLSGFKKTDGELYIESDGSIARKENPKFANASLQDALKAEGKEALYIEQEGKIYESSMYLFWHYRYKKYLENISTGDDVFDVHKIR